MTEAEWLASEGPAAMLAYLRVEGMHDCVLASDQKLALWRDAAADLCNCVRGPRQPVRIFMASRTPEEMAAMADATDCGCTRANRAALLREVVGNPWRPIIRQWGKSPVATGIWKPAGIVLDAWLTPTVLALAQTVHDEHAFYRMPFLGDALEEAGCTNAAILGHCRDDRPTVTEIMGRRSYAVSGGCCDRFADHMPCDCLKNARSQHVRGCWCLDAILGKS